MPIDYLPIAILTFFSIVVALAAVGIGHTFGPRRPTARKSEPYESGMRPYGPGQRRVPVHFYLVAVLFILFDIEIVFMLPWAVVFQDMKVSGLLQMGVFIGVLLVGYVYAWKKGALEWE